MKSLHTVASMIISLYALMSVEVFSAEGEASSQPVVSAMVEIPAGSYVPLYTTDKSARKVAAFQLDTMPVTNRQFLEFVKQNPRWQRSKVSKLFADQSYLKKWKSDTEPGPEVNLDGPVTQVSWFAARAFAKFYQKRLPTVDEWEYTARANQTLTDATQDENYTQVILKWYASKAPKILPSAKSYQANVYGIYAMHGLIWEWNEDFNNAMVTGESRGDSGLERNLFCAGGALSATDVRNYAAFMRFAFRSSLKGTYTTSSLGFRCARDLEKDTQ